MTSSCSIGVEADELLDMTTTPPFPPDDVISVVVPTRFDSLSDSDAGLLRTIPTIFAQERAALARELGAPIRIVESDPGYGSRWLVGPAGANPDLARIVRPRVDEPHLVLDREARLLISDAPTPAQVWETFSLLRSLARTRGGTLVVADCRDVAEAVERIDAEVADSYPSFSLRGVDWDAVRARNAGRVLVADEPTTAMQEWLAELDDAHTWVRPTPPLRDLPYDVWVFGGTARLARVPKTSAAWEAGARPGFRLLGCDADGWWRRTAATPHARPLLAGRRLLASEPRSARRFEAESPSGVRVAWDEVVPDTASDPVAEWRALPSGTGYLRVRVWATGTDLESRIDAAFSDLRRCSRLVVDLRGNGGGDVTIAQRFRDRFLREAGLMGWIRYSVAHGVLSEAEPITGEPAAGSARWDGPVRFLTDPLTYSASEDALLGLQGLDHVEVLGEPSGGGSGRMRTLRLLPGWRLTVSTALTYDRNLRCVEGAGIPVDRPIPTNRFAPTGYDDVLKEADAGW
jgi:carboxyl-terminal processing protease